MLIVNISIKNGGIDKEKLKYNMNRFLIVGSGSIGQRHIRCLISLGERKIAALRSKRGIQKELPRDISAEITELYNWQEAENWKPTHLIIANPTSQHLHTVQKGMDIGLNILVEKPFLSSYSELNRSKMNLSKLSDYQGFVGYNLRFHSIYQYIKKVIDEEKYGKILRAELDVGHFLPFWHPNEDYRESYAAQRKLGGGALRTLAHEIDLCQFLFDEITAVQAKLNKISNLEIDVEDNVDIFITCINCSNVAIHIDFLNPIPLRSGKLLFEKGLLEYDYFKNTVYFTPYIKNERQIEFEYTGDYNSQYIDQLKDFISQNYKTACSFKMGLKVDQIIEACEKSSHEKREICLV